MIMPLLLFSGHEFTFVTKTSAKILNIYITQIIVQYVLSLIHDGLMIINRLEYLWVWKYMGLTRLIESNKTKAHFSDLLINWEEFKMFVVTLHYILDVSMSSITSYNNMNHWQHSLSAVLCLISWQLSVVTTSLPAFLCYYLHTTKHIWHCIIS